MTADKLDDQIIKLGGAILGLPLTSKRLKMPQLTWALRPPCVRLPAPSESPTLAGPSPSRQTSDRIIIIIIITIIIDVGARAISEPGHTRAN